MKQVHTIKVSGNEVKSSGNENSYDYGHQYCGEEFASIETAKEAAAEINPKDFVGDLLTDFSGVSGSISIEIMTWNVDGDGEKELDTWEEVDGCMITFEAGDRTPMVDGVRN